MKNFAKSKGKRITAALLCAVMCIMSLPLSAFAFTAEEGKTVDAYYGDRYFGSDGDYYYSPESHQYIAYDENGNTSLHSASGVHRRTKLMIKDSSGSRQIMCIESGIDYNAGGTYSSVNGKNSSYFQNLPTTAQYGIMLTSVYGWRPGKTAPISGTNEDDFSYATQTILWEYQQQLRTSPTTLKANSYGIPADTYYQCLKGRPAEKCYNWLLTQMQSHATIPSFASNKSSSATTYTLKYNQAADNYSLTLTDTNNTLSDIKFSASGITVSRSGNKYTFTSNKMIETAVSVTAQKNVPGIDGNFLVWGYPGKQTMMSGAEDPVVFYLKIKTETTGVGHIVKHSEDGKVGNIKFNIAGNGVNQTVTTKTDGTVDIELMPGVWYTLISTRSGGSQCPYCSGIKLLIGFNDLATKYPTLAKEWSERNLPLTPDMVNEKSTKNVWWKCRTCGYEWKSVVRARAKGSLCPVCADRTVLAGYNDLATTDPELLDEWDYEKNTGTLPTAVSRNSMKIVWWKCSSSHSWRAKITDRTIEQKGCYLCEREFQSAFPQLLIMLYAVRNGLKVTTNNDKLIGINLDTYIPELRLAIEAEATTITEQRSQMVKEHICECNGIRYVKLKHSNDLIKTAQSIKEAFRKCHTFFQTNDEEDIEILRTRFQNWRKQK